MLRAMPGSRSRSREKERERASPFLRTVPYDRANSCLPRCTPYRVAAGCGCALSRRETHLIDVDVDAIGIRSCMRTFGFELPNGMPPSCRYVPVLIKL